MADFLNLKLKRSVLADILHIVFNLVFAILTLLLVIIFPETPLFAMALIFLGKWRIFAVRRRYWWPNFLASLPDLIVGFSLVVLMWQAANSANGLGVSALPIQIVLTILHIVWLIFIKPQHKEIWVVSQAATAQFLGFAALFSVASKVPLPMTIIFAFIVGYAIARQILLLHDEKKMNIIALIWGLVAAEISFAAWHWTIAYAVTPLIAIPQSAIIITLLGFATYSFYSGFRRHKKVLWEDVAWPAIFSSVVIILLVVVAGGIL